MATGSPFLLPFNPNDSKVGRIDQGVDISSSSPFTAVASGTVVHIDPNFYHGTPSVYVKLDHPMTVGGHTYGAVYYAETRSLVTVGQHVKAGQAVIGPGNAEIGFAARFGSSNASYLPAAHGHYREGDATTEGFDFAAIMKTGNDALAAAGAVIAPVTGAASGAANAVGGVVSATESVAHFLGRLTDPKFLLRLLEVVGGSILVLLGLYLLARQVGLATSPPGPLPFAGDAAGLSDSAAAEMQFSPGRAAAPRRRAPRTAEVTEASERRAAVRRRAARAEPSNEIPF